MNFEHVHKNMISESSARIASISTCFKSVLRKELEWYVVKDSVFIKIDFLINILDDHGQLELTEHLVHIRDHLDGVINSELIAKCLVEVEEIEKALKSDPFILNDIEFHGVFELDVTGFLSGRELFVIS